MMGRLADAVVAGGGEVIGVIPEQLRGLEVAHDGLSELHVVADMHQRKAKMASLAEGFIAMPGGLGTLEEIFEMATWAQLKLHAKPLGLLNVAGFFDPLVRFLDHAVAEDFLKAKHRDRIAVRPEPDELIEALVSKADGESEVSSDKNLI